MINSCDEVEDRRNACVRIRECLEPFVQGPASEGFGKNLLGTVPGRSILLLVEIDTDAEPVNKRAIETPFPSTDRDVVFILSAIDAVIGCTAVHRIRLSLVRPIARTKTRINAAEHVCDAVDD
ncbi:hypothetical protein BCA37_17830 [Mycobacterium sp. djl-10]|nr:hypothetical protein BCA37_17830 [Mycobacterium sp. djl-10]